MEQQGPGRSFGEYFIRKERPLCGLKGGERGRNRPSTEAFQPCSVLYEWQLQNGVYRELSKRNTPVKLDIRGIITIIIIIIIHRVGGWSGKNDTTARKHFTEQSWVGAIDVSTSAN